MDANSEDYGHMENEIKKLQEQLDNEYEYEDVEEVPPYEDGEIENVSIVEEIVEEPEMENEMIIDAAYDEYVPSLSDLPPRPISPFPKGKQNKGKGKNNKKGKIPLITKPTVTQFRDVDDFNNYYQDNREEFETTTTHMLNKKYKIPGFKITKIKGVVSLKNTQKTKPQIDEVKNEVFQKIDNMNDTWNNKLNTTLNNNWKNTWKNEMDNSLNPLYDRVTALESNDLGNELINLNNDINDINVELKDIRSQLIDKRVITALNSKIESVEESIVSLKSAYSDIVGKINEIIERL